MVKLFALMSILLAGLPGMAATATDTWVQVKSPHFVVLTDSTEKQARHVAAQFEKMRAIFHASFPKSRADSGAPVAIIAVKDRKSMQALEPQSVMEKSQSDVAGLFLRSPDKAYVLLRLDAPGQHAYAPVYHDYVHYLASGAAEWMPLWMNEGLAEYFQNTEIHDKDADLGQPNNEQISLLRQNKLIPLKTLLAADTTSPYYHEEQRDSIFYAESWALIHMLEIADQVMHTHLLLVYAEELSQRVDSLTAAERAFGDLGQLQKGLDIYIAGRSFQEFRVAIPNEVNESAYTVAAVTATEANAVRADLLAYGEREKDARTLLDAVLQQDPKNGQAHETMGYLELRAGDIDAARKWYQQAVELNPQSYLAHYYLGMLGMKDGGPAAPDQVEAGLRDAINLNPAFAPAYDQLAIFYAMHPEKLAQAHIMNLRAVQLDPANFRYRLNTANVLMEEKKYSDALTVMKVAVRLTKTAEELALAQERIKQLEQHQAQQVQSADVDRKAAGSEAGVAAVVAFPAPKHPTEEPHEPALLAKGVIKGVQCSEPAIIEFKVVGEEKNFSLYSNDYFSIGFRAANYVPEGEIHPCSDLEGAKASVKYFTTSDKTVDGQILSVELSR